MSRSLREKKIYLKGEPFCESSLNYIVEKFLLWRWSYFKNSGRETMLVLRAFISLILPFLLFFFIFECNYESSEIYLYAISGFSILYWNMNRINYKRWEYCANLYNRILEINCEIHRQTMINALAIDLVTIDLWANRSFKEFFYDELMAAINTKYKSSGERVRDEKEIAKKGKLTETEALEILEYRQEKLLEKRKELSFSCARNLLDGTSCQ